MGYRLTPAFLLALAVVALPAPPADGGGTLVLTFFGSETCEMCLQIKQDLLKPLEAKYRGRLKVKYYDMEDSAGLRLLTRMEEEYRVPYPSAQELYFPDTFLTGFADIMKLGRQKIEARFARQGGPRSPTVNADTGGGAKAAALKQGAPSPSP